jgi:hypothetical protein
MALLLRLKSTKPKPYSPQLHHLFSTSNSGDNDGGDGDKKPSFSESLRQVRSSFKQQPTSNSTPSPLSPPQQSESADDIVNKIQSFRYKTTVPDFDDLLTQKKPISFQDKLISSYTLGILRRKQFCFFLKCRKQFCWTRC